MAKRKKSIHKKKARPKRKRPAKSRAAGQATNSRTHTDYNRNHVEIQVGTAAQSIKRAVKLYEADLSKLYIRKRKAKTKSARGKLTKKMREVERKLNRLK